MSARFYRHLDGGYYRFVSEAMSADTDSPVIIYEHLWPFEPGLWVRARADFLARFSPVEAAEVDAACAGERSAAQTAVNAAKARRRAAKPA